MVLQREATTAAELRAGDDVQSMTHGRFTVATVAPLPHGAVLVTSTHGLGLTVSARQLFGRYVGWVSDDT